MTLSPFVSVNALCCFVCRLRPSLEPRGIFHGDKKTAGLVWSWRVVLWLSLMVLFQACAFIPSALEQK